MTTAFSSSPHVPDFRSTGKPPSEEIRKKISLTHKKLAYINKKKVRLIPLL
jgi:hypothetical protein